MKYIRWFFELDISREPARAVRTILAAIGGIAYLLAIWGVAMSPELSQQIKDTVEYLVPVLYTVMEFVRPLVASRATVATAVAAAKAEPATTAVVPSVALPGYQEQVKAELANAGKAPRAIRFERVG